MDGIGKANGNAGSKATARTAVPRYLLVKGAVSAECTDPRKQDWQSNHVDSTRNGALGSWWTRNGNGVWEGAFFHGPYGTVLKASFV
jgi:hypothetical protein